MGQKVLVFDSNPKSLQRIESLLSRGRFRAVVAEDSAVGLRVLREEGGFAAVIVVNEGVKGGLSGVDILQRIKGISPHVPVVMSSDSWTSESLLDCTEEGAFFCVGGPEGPGDETLLRVLNQAIEEHRLSPSSGGRALI